MKVMKATRILAAFMNGVCSKFCLAKMAVAKGNNSERFVSVDSSVEY